MTIQIEDSYVFHGGRFLIAGISGEDFFFPQNLQISPTKAHTGCWRGYVSSFEIKDSALFLMHLRICLTHRRFWQDPQKKIKAPQINGVSPKDFKSISEDFEYYYEDINLLVPFTGCIVLVQSHIEKFETNLEFKKLFWGRGTFPPWRYLTVFEITFCKGLVELENDLSEKMREAREVMMNEPSKYIHPESLLNWLNLCFSKDYNFKM